MPPKRLRILCLGASLVAGFTSAGAAYHPFSRHVAKMLGMILNMQAADIEMVVDGVPGDRVTTGTFVSRMQKHFSEGSEPFDWTIVLGATNDIAFPETRVEDIMKSFEEVWAIPLSHGSKVLALTVPQAAFDGANSPLVKQRNALNQRIKSYKAENFHVFDLHDALPYDGNHAKYWDDAIHFTPDGYDYIGDRVGTALVALILQGRTKTS